MWDVKPPIKNVDGNLAAPLVSMRESTPKRLLAGFGDLPANVEAILVAQLVKCTEPHCVLPIHDTLLS